MKKKTRKNGVTFAFHNDGDYENSTVWFVRLVKAEKKTITHLSILCVFFILYIFLLFFCCFLVNFVVVAVDVVDVVAFFV